MLKLLADFVADVAVLRMAPRERVRLRVDLGLVQRAYDVEDVRRPVVARGLRSTCVKLPPVDKYEQVRLQILQGKSDANIDFNDLRGLLLRLGFEERIRGSHHVFRKQGVRELINLQKDGNKAKVYQVRQVRQILLRYGLEGGR